MTSNIGSPNNSSFQIDLGDRKQQLTVQLSVENTAYKNIEEIYSKLRAYFSNSTNVLTSNDTYFDYIYQVSKTFSLCVRNDLFPADVLKDREMKYLKLQTAGICLKILRLYLENPHTTEAMKLIIQTSLSVLYEAYMHCKDSETFYGDLFDEFTDELGIFYKHIQPVQSSILRCLDELVASNSFNIATESTEIKSITNDVGRLCELLICLDRMIAAALWKIFVKLISKYEDILLGKIQVESFLVPLVSDVENIVIQCIYNIESQEQIGETEIKLCLVEMSTVKKIVEIFRNYLSKEVVTQLRNFALHLNKLLVLCHSFTVCEGQDLNIIKILLKTIRHVIMPFFTDNLFFSSTLHCNSKEVSADLLIPLILLKLSALDYVKSENEYVELLQNGKILMEILSTLAICKPEDDLNFVSIKIPSIFLKELKNECDKLLTLYKHCYFSLAECSKHISESIFTTDAFIRNLLCILNSCSDVVFLLISDVWIFYARCGSIDNLYKKCVYISEYFMKEKYNSRIELLLKRMFKFLPSDDKVKIFEAYENLYELFCTRNNFYRFESSQHISSLPVDETKCVQINSLLKDLKETDSHDLQKLVQKACSILKLGTLCIEKFSPRELLKFIEFSAALFGTEIYEIQANVLMLLKSLKGKVLSNNKEELEKLTSSIAILLSSSLQSKNYIIRVDAFNIYFCLAQTTPHSDMIRKTVIKSPSLVPSVKAYAEKNPSSGFLSAEEKSTMLKKQLKKLILGNPIPQTIPCEAEQILHSVLT